MAVGLIVTSDDALDDLIHRADLDGLVRMIDDRCSTRDWAGLLRIRDRSRHAVETGRQLWPAATLAEYRLALLATPDHVAAVLDESDGLSGRFTIGPLTEVAAQHHTWDELRSVLDLGPRAAFVAHERVLRGERVEVEDLPDVLDLPLELHDWEPDYPLAVYTDVGAEFPMPDLPDSWIDVTPVRGESARRRGRPRSASARRAVVDGVERPRRGRVRRRRSSARHSAHWDCSAPAFARLEPSDALAWLAWAGASGGAHGRRRGAASGRFGAWWTLAALGDLLDDWPVPPDELGELAAELRWYRWDAYEPAMGWQLQLAVEDPDDDVAWAILARDAT